MNATEEQIKTTYRKLAKKHHPDKNGIQKNFILLKEAYEKALNFSNKNHSFRGKR